MGALAPTTLAVGRHGAAAAVAEVDQPAPFTRCGPGISREIKPELVEYGGNLLHYPDGDVVQRSPGTDVMMASHQLTPAVVHDSGTSFAAPRVAHKLARVLGDLQSLGLAHVSAPLLRAFIVNSATCDGLANGFGEFCTRMEQRGQGTWQSVAGYGVPAHDPATCDAYSAVLFYQGELSADSVAFFEVPVPAALASGESGTKRLTVTVAHAPEVQRWGLEQYLGTTLRWRLFRGDADRNAVIASMSANEADDADLTPTDRPDELRGRIGIRTRSRGTVQHDVIEWQQHQERYSAGHYTLAVAAHRKWSRATLPVPFAVVIRLEDTTRTTQVYSEVQSILAEIEVRTHTR